MSVSVRFSPLPSISELLKLYRVRALKKLSQNFLLDKRISDKIVRAAGNLRKSEVCEIGPGPGGITRSILKNDVVKLILIEKDERFKPILENLAETAYDNIDVHFTDIMGFDMSQMFDRSLEKNWADDPPNIHLIGNLPFSVSTPLIFQWLKDISLKKSAWSYGRVRMTLTFQEEVAERMVAVPFAKNRCRLSVMCQNWCNVHHKFTIPGTAFLPKPDVNVGVVHLEPLIEPVIPLEFHFVEKVLREMFNVKKKYAFNSAEKLFPVELRKKLTTELLKRAGISSAARAYNLTNEEWGRICLAFKSICDEDPRLYHYNHRGNCLTREDDWKT